MNNDGSKKPVSSALFFKIYFIALNVLNENLYRVVICIKFTDVTLQK